MTILEGGKEMSYGQSASSYLSKYMSSRLFGSSSTVNQSNTAIGGTNVNQNNVALLTNAFSINSPTNVNQSNISLGGGNVNQNNIAVVNGGVSIGSPTNIGQSNIAIGAGNTNQNNIALVNNGLSIGSPTNIGQSNISLGGVNTNQNNIALVNNGLSLCSPTDINQNNTAIGGCNTNQNNIAIVNTCTPCIPCTPQPPCKPPVAPCEWGSVTGDPHFRGGDGESYNIYADGGTVFSIVKDKNFDYNAKFNYWGNNGVSESSVRVKNATGNKTSIVYFKANGTATLVNINNGVKTETTIQQGQTYNLADGGTVKFGSIKVNPSSSTTETRLIVTSSEGYTLSQKAYGSHINSTFETSSKGTESDGVATSGLLGDTFDPDSTKRIPTDNKGTGVLNKALSAYALGTDITTIAMQGVNTTAQTGYGMDTTGINGLIQNMGSYGTNTGSSFGSFFNTGSGLQNYLTSLYSGYAA